MSAFLILLAVIVVLMFAVSAFDLPARRRYGDPLVDRGPDRLEEDLYDDQVVRRPRPRRVARRRRL